MNDELSRDVLYRNCSVKERCNNGRPVCENFASHGWCTSSHRCLFSHDIDDILDLEAQIPARSRGSKRHRLHLNSDPGPRPAIGSLGDAGDDVVNGGGDVVVVPAENSKDATRNTGRTDSTSSEGILQSTHGHRAGYDAFMTGFSMACLMAQQIKGDSHRQRRSSSATTAADDAFRGLNDFRNKLFLSRKDFQLTVSKSAFGKVFRQHQWKMERIRRVSCS